jgi:ectoine hydroxylase-related dioxygenase (phytanoyl-CoA dioxygenase family)
MKRFREIDTNPEVAAEQSPRMASLDALASELETNGLVVLPPLLTAEQLKDMQDAFAARLRRLRWNNFDGYQRTEIYRHMVEDVLLLAQGFVDLAVHPLVKQLLTKYLGRNYQLTEAKGWKSLPTSRDFHGWHGDMWYEQKGDTPIYREIKLAMYLTDVRSGAFNFIKGTHQKQHPHKLKRDEVSTLPLSELVELKGAAGTVFLFDTSIIHRQAFPCRAAPGDLLRVSRSGCRPQQEDVDYYRYHPMLLNAAFLGNLSEEDQRILASVTNETSSRPLCARINHADL